MTTIQERVSLLGHARICEGLESSELEILARHLNDQNIDAGEEFIEHDSLSKQVYFIVEGSVEVTMPLVGNRGTTILTKLGRGETVGEFALIRQARRSATGRAMQDLKVLVTDRDSLTQLFAQHPTLGLKIYRNLATILVDRLIDANHMIRNVSSQF